MTPSPLWHVVPSIFAGGVKARLFRISFSGELGFEIAVPARFGNSMMRTLMAAGQDFNVTLTAPKHLALCGIEKGHVAGNELNGQTTARQMGLGEWCRKKGLDWACFKPP